MSASLASDSAARPGAAALSILDQAHLAVQKNRFLWAVPSSSIPGHFHQVNIERETCSCPGSETAIKHGHPCRHVYAVWLRIASELLEVEGEPDADTLQLAIKDINSEAELLRYNRFYNGYLVARYGRYPNSRRTPGGSIGLSVKARRSLSSVEQRAILYSLEQIEAEFINSAS